MPYEVLARKWRPQVFQEVVGQEHITQTLMNAIRNGRLAHAYLFGGPRGVGKTSVARILAKAINCERGEPGVPCNQCRSCTEITDGSSVDVQEIDGASNRGIDEIRELRENIKYMPASSRYRIYIIDEVHMLTKEAFNALLKTLEEPPAHVKFIFATTEAHKVPVTILSRCQRFDFKRIPTEKIVRQLEKIAKAEGIEISQSALSLISREAEGSMRDAESLTDQVVSFTGPHIEDRSVREILGIIDTDITASACLAIIEGSAEKCLEIVNQIYNYGYDIKEFYRALMDRFRDLLITLIAPREHLLEMGEAEKEEARKQAQMAGREKLQALLNFLIRREEDLRFTSHPRLILETTMIKMCQMGEYLSFGDLLKKIESLEKKLSGGLMAADPAADWTSSGGGHSDTSGSAVAEPPAENWNAFLAYLSTRSKAMYNVLKGWQCIRLTQKRLEIGNTGQAFSSVFFEDPERRDQLAAYCREFFKRDLTITLVENNRHQEENTPAPKEAAPESAPGDLRDLPPAVQDLLQMFQGRIRGERSGNESERTEEVKP